MKIINTLILCNLLFFSNLSTAQSLSGIKIGDHYSVAASLGMDPVAFQKEGPFDFLKYSFKSGNILSLTVDRQSQKIVYMESDWGGRSAGAYSDYPGFSFGRTTLSEVRKKLGSNGMAFTERPVVSEVQGGIVTFNSYEIGSVVVTFVTKVIDKDIPRVASKEIELGQASKLDAIIIMSPEYADMTWGRTVRYSSYRKGRW
jgi:hypothetical protein